MRWRQLSVITFPLTQWVHHFSKWFTFSQLIKGHWSGPSQKLGEALFRVFKFPSTWMGIFIKLPVLLKKCLYSHRCRWEYCIKITSFTQKYKFVVLVYPSFISITIKWDANGESYEYTAHLTVIFSPMSMGLAPTRYFQMAAICPVFPSTSMGI